MILRFGLTPDSGAARPTAEVATIEAPHTLSLQFFPHRSRTLEARTGPLRSRLLPDGLAACHKALKEDGYDFMLMLHHSAVPILRRGGLGGGGDADLGTNVACDGVPA